MSRIGLRLLIFDLDGTLIESRKDIAAATNHVRGTYSLAPLDQKTVDSYIGSGLTELVRKALKPSNEQELGKAMEIFQVFYREHCLDQTELYPGVKETLEMFHRKGKKMAVATNKKTDLSRRILDGLQVGPYLELVIGGDGQYKRKPDPETLRVVMDTLKTPPDQTAMIGDSSLDIEAGRRAGVALTCGVTYGIGDRRELEASGPDVLIERFDRLQEVLSSP